MQPCSQPRYGFTLVSNPTSGLSFRAMIVFVWSRKNCVSRRGLSSSSLVGSIWTTSASPKSTCSFSNRFAGSQEALRPWIAGEGGGASSTIGTNFFFALFCEPGTAQVHMNIYGCRTHLRHLACAADWRRGWDSNPRGLAPCRFSRPEPSTTRPPLQLSRRARIVPSARRTTRPSAQNIDLESVRPVGLRPAEMEGQQTECPLGTQARRPMFRAILDSGFGAAATPRPPTPRRSRSSRRRRHPTGDAQPHTFARTRLELE